MDSVKNNLEDIAFRAQYWVHQLMDANVRQEFIEMDVLNVISDEILNGLGYESSSYNQSKNPQIIELKKALKNMYFLGKTLGKNTTNEFIK